MTKRERSQLVELLRCAADARLPFKLSDAGYALGHADGIGHCSQVYSFAMTAMNVVYDDAIKARRRIEGPRVERWLHLEAAARVEEGSWP